MPIQRLLACLSLPLAAASVAAQGSFIVPSRLPDLAGTSTATARGTSSDTILFWYGGATTVRQPLRKQLFWANSDIPVPVANLLSIAFRRQNNSSGANPSATATLQLDLAVSPNSVAGRSTTFANNLVGGVTTVFNGTVNLPPDPYSGPGPAAFNVPIPFTVPFTYVASAGNSLVADFQVSNYTPISANATWSVDGITADGGLRIGNGGEGSQCLFSNGVGQNAIGHQNPVLGGQWFVQYQSGSATRIPSGLAGLGLWGTQGAGTTWNGIPLPLQLQPLGGGANCALKVGFLFVVALTENAVGGIYDWPRLSIPNDPLLYDQSFVEQGLFVDLPANPLGLVTTWSSRWTIRSGTLPAGASIYQYNNNGTPTPSPTTGFNTTTATIAQFNY